MNRSWLITCNYFTQFDVENLLLIPSRYTIIGLEGVHELTNVHAHFHAFVYFKDAKTLSAVQRYFERAPHLDSVKDPSSAIDYCKGYKNSQLKEPQCGPNIYYEFGIPPEFKVAKQHLLSQLMSDVKEGATLIQLYEKYPSFMFHHSTKVVAYINTIQPDVETKFYHLKPIADAISEVNDTFPDSKIAWVTDLSQLQAYSEYDTVVYECDYHDRLHDLWVRKVPITYKFGYQLITVKTSRFIIVNQFRQFYPLYIDI
nr:MAG: replication associated protein [Cressdnaviricota sp.]